MGNVDDSVHRGYLFVSDDYDDLCLFFNGIEFTGDVYTSKVERRLKREKNERLAYKTIISQT